MPLTASTVNALKADIAASPSDTVYVIASSAPDETGENWCELCTLAAPDIERVSSADNIYGLSIKYKEGEARRPENWIRTEYKLIGVPSIFRIVGGERKGTPLSYKEEGFGEELDAFVKGPEKYEAFLKEKKGSEYKDDAERWEMHLEDFDMVQEMIRQAEEEKAKAAEEKKGVKCDAEVCIPVSS